MGEEPIDRIADSVDRCFGRQSDPGALVEYAGSGVVLVSAHRDAEQWESCSQRFDYVPGRNA